MRGVFWLPWNMRGEAGPTQAQCVWGKGNVGRKGTVPSKSL